LTFVGDTGLAGPAPTTQISCDFPKGDGTVFIFVLAQPANPAVTFNIQIVAGKITASVFAGAGTTFTGREFEGTGVTGFDAAKGVQIDTTLTEVTNSGDNPGTLGAITSMKGSIDCGNQTTGTSTVTITGDTADGAVNGALGPFRVQCNSSASQGNSVAFPAVAQVGNMKALFFTTFAADSIISFESNTGTPAIQRSYMLKAPGVVTLSANGAHVSGDAVEQNPTSGPAHTLHFEGDVTCGSTLTLGR
jgi:hypothetical protein